ncbi:MAG: DNA photolyase family protein [Patescibacteria group bacterium]|nr:DNA photolyase family protein [Patescibacteria group bacterium]
MKSIYWFKRDLRVEDNRALQYCLKESKEVYPIFIFDEDILKKLNAFDNRLYFLKLLVEDLAKKINLNIFYGKTGKVFEYLIEKIKPNKVYTAESLTWEGENRVKLVKNICQKRGIDLTEIFDNFLTDPRKIEYTKIFTHFFRKWLSKIDNLEIANNYELIKKTKKIKSENFLLPDKIAKIKPTNNFYWTLDFLENRLKDFNFKNYHKNRNFLFIDGTSKLSPYIRFGVISIRKLFNKVKDQSSSFISELAWREFWYHIKHYFPDFKNLEFQGKRRNLKWENDQEFIKNFEEAKTGHPIIDAAIVQLKTENWMHNRARMIVGSFLTKDLLIDWRIGEKFFSRYLIDYDEVVNTGNWQWVASVGPDPKTLRIFNPILQTKKFDPQALYIKKYLPHLEKYSPSEIINLKIDYYEPIVKHQERIKIIKSFYR